METNDENFNDLPEQNSSDDPSQILTIDDIATKKVRFLNLLVDYGIIYLIGQFIMVRLGMSYIWLGPVLFLYCFILEALFGVTLGKIITSTRVSDVNGNKPTIISIFIRSLARLIPFEAFSYLSSSGRGWHDFFSGTYVIYKKTR